MSRHTFPVLQSDAAHVEAALTNYNEWEEKQETATVRFLPYKAKKIKLISKEKSSSWNENISFNLYSYTISYVDADALFRFGEQVGVAKAVALSQQVYGREVLGG